MSVGEATARDLDDAAALFDAYRVFYRQASNLAAARAFLAERFRRKDSVVLLARQHGVAVGFVQLYPSLSSVSMQRIWILNDLYVAPGARGGGVGRRLMDRACEVAHNTGAVRLELTTERSNNTAQTLYRRCGNVRDDVFYKFVLTVDTRA